MKKKVSPTKAKQKKPVAGKSEEPSSFLKSDPAGDNSPTLSDGRRYSIGNPDEKEPVESWDSWMAREELQEEERSRQKSFWKLVLETEKFNEEGIISVADEEKLSDPPLFLYLGLITEQMKFLYGKYGDWRAFLCMLARNDSEARKELSWRLTKAATEGNTVEMAAFQKAVSLIRKRHKNGTIGKLRDSQFFALRCVVQYWNKFKQYPTQDDVEKWVRENGLYFPSKEDDLRPYQQGSKRYLFFVGPILSKCTGRSQIKKPAAP